MNYLKFGFNFAVAVNATLAMSAGRVISSYDAPELDQVKIASVTMAGSGCVDGIGASVDMEEGALIFEALDLGAVAGDQHRRSESRESCQFIVDLSVPEGWTYAVSQVSGGIATELDLDTMAQADFATWFSAGGEEGAASLPVYAEGVSSQDFALDIVGPVYAPCDAVRSLKFKMAVRVDVGGTTNSFAAAEFNAPIKLGLQWKRCGDNLMKVR